MQKISMLLLCLLIAIGAMAEGKIAGKVTDEKTGEAIIGATVLVKGTPNGTATDIDGAFNISVAPGTYAIEVKYIGYQSKEVADIVVTEGNTTTVDLVLSESKSTELTEFVVRSSIKQESINAIYTRQKNAASISDGISADVIKKSPDRTTGEVLKRVSGTTIQDNKFVIVRGLGDRYNTALIDNTILPSTEPNRKAFSFDIIPSALIDNIIISKAATPDLPGDFAGGAIQILTKETPEQNFNSIAIGAGYNTVSTGRKFQSGYRTGTDILGFDDGSRALPGSFPSSKEVIGGLNKQQSITVLQQLNNDYTINEHSALPAVSLQGALGRLYRLKHSGKIGLTAAVTYNHNETIKKDLIRQYDNFDYIDQVYTYSSSLGALVNLGYYFGNNKIVFKSLYNRVFDDNFLSRQGYNYGSTSDIRYYAYDLVQKSLLKTSLEGEHQVGKKQAKFNWVLAYNLITNDQPDQRKVSYSRLAGSASVFSADNTSLGKANNRLFSNLNENVFSGGANFSSPYKFLNKSSLKIGTLVQYRVRDFSNRYIGAIADPGAPNVDEIRTRDISQLYAPDVIANGTYYLNDLTTDADKYDATTSNIAGYAMSDNKLTDNLRLVFGARVESYSLDLKAGQVHVNTNWLDVLPSANLSYSLNERANLRASYFRSVARPELREIAPLAYYDYELSATVNGNPNLVRSQIDNFDLRYEIYPAAGEVISASVFYKSFTRTIENTVYAENSSYEITTINYGTARNIGIEAEVRKNLGFIAEGSPLKDITFYVNAAYIKSNVSIEEPYYVRGSLVKSRALSGQSPYVINTSLSYSALQGKLNFTALYNRIGQRIFLVGQGRLADVYEMPRNLLDLQAAVNLSKRSELKLNVKDILNSPVRFYFDQNGNEKFDNTKFEAAHINSDIDWTLQSYKPGTTFTLTYTYKF
jgi:TonB-dependent receptor